MSCVPLGAPKTTPAYPEGQCDDPSEAGKSFILNGSSRPAVGMGRQEVVASLEAAVHRRSEAECRRALRISVFLCAAQQFSGINALVFYQTPIMKDANISWTEASELFRSRLCKIASS